jgi:hypothetical protein
LKISTRSEWRIGFQTTNTGSRETQKPENEKGPAPKLGAGLFSYQLGMKKRKAAEAIMR